MKPETNTFGIDSTMQGEKVAMAIRAEDMAHIMGVMTNLYENRLLAVIREYSTNALDAHIEAGVSLPIEITLPSSFAPTLTIRDYGVGLTVEDIRTIYSQYGRSTKRGSNDQVGMLGLGCKSALTYTTQFTVSSVKDGHRVTVLVSREEDGGGVMQILGNEPTDDASGTEVMVSILRQDIYRASQLAEDFFQYWDADTVLLNGRSPDRIEGLKITDRIMVVEHDEGDKVVMGNVAYPVTLDIPGTSPSYRGREFSVVARVGIGEVRPTPSRESLMDVKATNAAMQAIVDEYTKSVKGAIQAEINKCNSPQDAIRTIFTWNRYIGKQKPSDYTYHGVAVPDAWAPINPLTKKPYDEYEYPVQANRFRTGYYKATEIQGYRSINVEMWPATVWVANFLPAKYTPSHRAKLLKWCEDNNIGQNGEVQQFILCPSNAPSSTFIDSSMIVEWEIIKAVKVERATTTSWGGVRRIPGSYDLFTEKGSQTEVSGGDIRQDKPLFYVHGNIHAGYVYQSALDLMYPEYTLVCLSLNRIEKFKRDASTVKEVQVALTEGYKTWSSKRTKDELSALAMLDSRSHRPYKVINPSKVNDPRIKEACRLARIDVAKLQSARNCLRPFIHTLGDDFDASFDDPIDDYPLAASYVTLREHPEDSYLYMNAAYAARKTP